MALRRNRNFNQPSEAMSILSLLPLVCIILAAVCNAVMDRIDDENIHDSIWKGSNWEWWYKRESWDNAKKIFGWKYDGWHVFKSAMIVFLISAIVIACYTGPLFNFGTTWQMIGLQIIFYGFVWNGTFNLFYDGVFKRKAK